MRVIFSPAIRVALIYFIFSIIWIFTSDSIVASLTKDPEVLNILQTIKGWFFVTFTSFLIYFLINKYFKREKELRKNIEEKIKDFETIVDESPNPIMVYDTDGNILILNKTFLESTGYDFSEIDTLKKWNERAFKQKSEKVNEIAKEVFLIDKKVDNGIFEVYTKSDKKIYWHFNSTPFGVKNGKKILMSTALDVTELEHKNNLFIKQSKMAALGEMIENIAHQWRQPLSVISTLSTGIQLKHELNDLDDEYLNSSLQTLNDNAQYLSKTIDDFRNFFEKDKDKLKFNLKDTIEKTIKLIDPKIKNTKIEILEDLVDLEYEGFENEFIQVLMNIITNATDALLETDRRKLIFITLKIENENIVITIKDSAGGINDDIIDKIFEPYFTTKYKSQGTGIGLYMAKEIVSKHMDGFLSAENNKFVYEEESFKGAKFIITLPLNKSLS